jgi:hypothetical protein
MDAWDRADIFEFYTGLEIHKARVDKLLKKNKAQPWH